MSPSSLLVPGFRHRRRVVPGRSPAFCCAAPPRALGAALPFATALAALVPALLLG